MATTGFENSRKDAYVCKGCANDANLSTSNLRTVEDSQFRHGNGGGPCAICGLDTLDTLARKALRGRTERDLVTVDNLEDEVDRVEAVAKILDEAYTHTRVRIELGPGETPEKAEIAPGVSMVQHSDDADETLYVDIPEETPAGVRSRTDMVQETLEAWDWRLETIDEPMGENGPDAQVRAVPPEQ
ncbi:hypothetical protein [Halorhabdus rudnickae]|uniref:hypothetical protein n=1 Tax=Halorhabdus rudnickae TaxID=1775544 RepID=UPI001083C3B4|nr:hypothetical protein [Halorhabdus rudnickae]